MSFVISANRLVTLTQSPRLRDFLERKFSVNVLPSPITTPYHCNLYPGTIQVALDAALAGTNYLLSEWDEERKSFIDLLLKDLRYPEVFREKPTVHAELALIMAMVNGEIDHVKPYIGVSKLSCIMCSRYICAFNRLKRQTIATKGTHGKAYPGWFWPSLPDHDEELRPAFLGLIREQLLDDFEDYTEEKRLSDSSVGSGFPGLDIDPTSDEIIEMFESSTGVGL